jgi:hypothetical protein
MVRTRISQNMFLNLSKYLYGIWAPRSLSMGNILSYGSMSQRGATMAQRQFCGRKAPEGHVCRKQNTPISNEPLASHFERFGANLSEYGLVLSFLWLILCDFVIGLHKWLTG